MPPSVGNKPTTSNNNTHEFSSKNARPENCGKRKPLMCSTFGWPIGDSLIITLKRLSTHANMTLLWLGWVGLSELEICSVWSDLVGWLIDAFYLEFSRCTVMGELLKPKTCLQTCSLRPRKIDRKQQDKLICKYKWAKIMLVERHRNVCVNAK